MKSRARYTPTGIGLLQHAFICAAVACINSAALANEADLTSWKTGDSAPNVVLIIVDSLRADHLGCYGHDRDTSPNIDALAKQGVRFTRAFSQAPWTTPSIGSLLTSQYPTTLGIKGERSGISEDLLLLPEVLNAGGYATGGVISHSFCSSKWGFGQGIEDLDESNIKGHTGVTSNDIADRAIEYLASKWDKERPFFLMVHFFDPHFAWIEHEGLSFGGNVGYEGKIKSGTLFSVVIELKANGELTDADIQESLRLYDSEIAYTDRAIGRIFDHLRERKLYDDSMIVFTADHGDEFLDHGAMGHSRKLYNEVVRVPLIIKFPGGRHGEIDRPVPLLDIYPTILEVAGLEVKHPIEGVSITNQSERPFFIETSRGAERRALISGNFKFIRNNTAKPELYDLRQDPLEEHDLAAERLPLREAMQRELDIWMKAVEATASSGPTQELTNEEVKNLTALGYIAE
jgi:arylsulfatase A-like enzyme